MTIQQIGLGGGCHWCTEAVFQALKGVIRVQQGWVSSTLANQKPSEAVLIDFDESLIELNTLLDIHCHTHASTSKHSMRTKYRSAQF